METTKDFSQLWSILISLLGVILASSVVIEISPIKINPLQKIFELCTRSFTQWMKGVIETSLKPIEESNKKRDEIIDSMSGKIDAISDRINDNEARAQRNHIAAVRRSVLGFADALRGGMDASLESFDDILEQADEYKQYIDETNTPNGKMILSLKFIDAEYEKKFNHPPKKSG